ncbi:MAG: type III secretion system inner membrane ring subunit SctD [Thiotrichales bacterium]
MRVLSGPNKGAVALIREGVHRVGASFENDFVLMGPGVNKHHLELRFVDGVVSVRTISGDVEISGRAVGENPVTVFPGSILSLGSVDLLINVKAAPRQPPRGARGGSAKRAFLRGEDWLRHARLFEDTSPGQPRRLRLPNLTRIVVLGILAAFLMLSLTGKDVVGGHRPAVAPQPTAPQVLTSVLAALPADAEVAVQQSGGGRTQVVGHVLTSDQVRTLRKALDESGSAADLRVISTEELAASARKVLSALGLNGITVMPSAPGKLAWSGMVRHPDELHAALVTIKSDIPRILDINTKDVLTLPVLADELSGALAEVEPLRHLKVSIDDTRLHVSGVLSNSGQADLDELLARFMISRNGVPDVRNETRINQTQDFRLNIKSISVGGNAILELVDGQKYGEGSTLSNGMVLEKISMSSLILKDGSNSIEYSVGERK